MAGDPMPAPVTIEDFRNVARTAGERVKEAIEDGLTPATETTAFFSYRIEPVEPESPEYVKLLDDAMKQFEAQVSGVRIRTRT
jgi:hypothetical protein